MMVLKGKQIFLFYFLSNVFFPVACWRFIFFILMFHKIKLKGFIPFTVCKVLTEF